MKYVFIEFIPGAAGNFFSRCLNLLNGSVCWSKDNKLPNTLEERIELVTYRPVMHRNYDGVHWAGVWERKLRHYSKVFLKNVDGNLKIFLRHPNTRRKDRWKDYKTGVNDSVYQIYIDPSEAFEWCILNALYKNTVIYEECLRAGIVKQQSQTVFKISLANIINNAESFIEEFKKVCVFLGHTLDSAEIDAVINLYNEWKTTVLPPDRFDEFKNKIGWYY